MTSRTSSEAGPAGSEPAPALELRRISRSFGDVRANDGVDLLVRPGEVHALVGENGAGKTTLMNIVYGVLQPDSGQILLDGVPVSFRGPQQAIEHGIGMVHQHFMLVPSLTVLDNVVLGTEPSRAGLLDARRARRDVATSMDRIGLPLDLDATTGTLGVATQQQLEIVKVLHRGARVIILDEPTAVLTPQETEELFALLRRLAAEGAAVVFISHKLREVFEIADRVTVLRAGRSIMSRPVADTDTAEVVAAMTGSTEVELGRVQRSAPSPDAPTVLRADRLVCERPAHDAALDGVSLEVRAGEVVGVAAVEGNGQSSLVECLVGTWPITSGSLEVTGSDVTTVSVAGRRDAGLSYVPEDRQHEGLPLHGTVVEALAAGRIRRDGRGSRRAIGQSVRGWAEQVARRYNIVPAGIDRSCMTLSGGNQQKVVVARELEEKPRLLVLAQPTRGVDLGAIDFLYRRVAEATERGCAVLLVSADLDELLRLSDRILVMFEGRVVAEHDAITTSRDQLGHDMTGGSGRGVAA